MGVAGGVIQKNNLVEQQCLRVHIKIHKLLFH